MLLILLSSSLTFAQTTVDEDSDIVGWTDASLNIPLVKGDEDGKKVDKLTATFNAGFRYGRNLKRPIDQRVGVNLTYRINKYFSVGSGYLYHRFRPNESPRQYEHRVLFYLLAEKQFKRVTLKNRALTTYLIKHSNPDTVVYRNRVQANFPIKKNNKEVVTPFIADEPFYNFRIKKWFRNDIYAGVSKQFTPKFGADFFYVHQRFNTGLPRQTNGFGISLRYKVDWFK